MPDELVRWPNVKVLGAKAFVMEVSRRHRQKNWHAVFGVNILVELADGRRLTFHGVSKPTGLQESAP